MSYVVSIRDPDFTQGFYLVPNRTERPLTSAWNRVFSVLKATVCSYEEASDLVERFNLAATEGVVAEVKALTPDFLERTVVQAYGTNSVAAKICNLSPVCGTLVRR